LEFRPRAQRRTRGGGQVVCGDGGPWRPRELRALLAGWALPRHVLR
jgi:hypothetical protein